MRRFTVFGLLTGANLVVSRASLARPRGHGLPRALAFELLGALVFVNAPWWFRRPLAPRQVTSWLGLAGSALLAVHAFMTLRRLGKPGVPRPGEATFGFENTTELVTSGAYHYVRHPLYASLLLFAWAAFLKRPALAPVALATGASAALWATARVEEIENERTFGAGYAVYKGRTKMFIPGVW